MIHELPSLPYAPDALKPIISEETLEYHYGKHHQAYVNNLNKLLPGSAFSESSLEEIIRQSDGGIFNNAAQVWNHTFYFTSFSPGGKREPEGSLKKEIDNSFGSYAEFRDEFSKAAATLFGSGWAWLVIDKNGRLRIMQESNAGNPLRNGHKPMLTWDVWEHAYYIDYRNRRPDYINAFWDVLDWDIVEKRF